MTEFRKVVGDNFFSLTHCTKSWVQPIEVNGQYIQMEKSTSHSTVYLQNVLSYYNYGHSLGDFEREAGKFIDGRTINGY